MIFIFAPLCKYFGLLDVRGGSYVCKRNASHISAAREKSRISYRSRFSCPSFFCFRDAYHKRGIVSTLPCPGRARTMSTAARRSQNARADSGYATVTRRVTWTAPLPAAGKERTSSMTHTLRKHTETA